MIPAQAHQCPHCHASAYVRAKLESAGGGTPRVMTDEGRASPIATLVCTSCGHMQVYATDPATLRGVPAGEERVAQEYDF